MAHGSSGTKRAASTSTNTNEEDDEMELPPPPDGGWGWMVVFGSFMIHIVTDGVTYSFGVFYNEFLDYFQEGKGATAWILSILVGVTLCSGPISSSFVNKWGCRPVTIAGAILASISMIASCYAQNVTTLYFTVGIGTGLGFGLIYLPAIVSVTTYFEKKRSLATGIAVCGSGFGTFIFAPIINYLLKEYGWRGAMLITAALVLECVIFGALFRPLEYEIEEKEGGEKSEITLKEAEGTHRFETAECLKPYNPTAYMQRPHSMGHFSLPKPSKGSISERNGNVATIKGDETARLALSHPALCTSLPTEGSLRHHYASQHLVVRPLYKPDVFYQGSLLNIPHYKSHGDLNRSIAEETNLMERRHSTVSHKWIRRPSCEEPTTICCGAVSCSPETKDTLKQMLDVSLLKDPIFVLFTLSNFFTSIGFNIPYVYIVSKATDLGISNDKASMLLSVIGIANTFGRIILGYVSDKPWINRLWVYNLCLTTSGIATALSAFCVDFVSLAIYGSVFGFTIGAYVGLTSVILVDLLGLEKLTNAFGLLLLFQGIASLIGPPIAGGLYDILASYDPGFYVSGITIALSGVMLFAVPPLQNLRKAKELQSRDV